MKHVMGLALLLVTAVAVSAADAVKIDGLAAARESDAVRISFNLSAPADIEVAILDSKEHVVRHLAAGVLGGAKPPPEPLQPGLSQKLLWDGKDDFGKTVPGGPFKIRARAGMDTKFGRFIGEDPYNFGAIDGIVADEDGNVYVSGANGGSNQMAMCMRVFDAEGRYLREMLPFPSDLPPDAMKDIARWDDERKAFLPRNMRNLNPDFYGQPGGSWGNSSLTLLSASTKNGVVMTNSATLFTLDTSGAVHGAKFASRELGGAKNSGGGPSFVTISPDGKWVYLSGPYSNTNSYGYVYDPNFPPGRVYRAPLAGAEKFKEFVTIPVEHKDGNGGAWLKTSSNLQHFNCARGKGPVDGVAIDQKGNVYVADREHSCVAVFDENAKEIGKIAIKNPYLVAVHPKTGAIYVTQFDCAAYHSYSCVVHKFENFKEGAQAVAKFELPPCDQNGNHAMAVAAGKDKTVIWMAGVKGGLLPLEDKGSSLEPMKSQFTARDNVPGDWNRLAVDYDRDEIYISNGTALMYRYNGATGEGGLLMKDKRPFLVSDLAVGYDGLLYARVSDQWVSNGGGSGYSGPLWRIDHELNPAPFSGTSTHVLSPYIYNRMGVGYAERGLGVGPDGKVYISFMYKWVAYAIGGFDGTGKPLKGKYLQGVFPAEDPKNKKSYPADWDSAILGPLPMCNANIRVDLKGNLYVAMMYRAKDFAPPKAYEKDQGYRVSVGSVVKFPSDGGVIKNPENFAGGVEGALNVYTGLAPFSSSCEAFGNNTCCVCRVPRFDLDRYGRVAMPNAMTNSVLVFDNAGNLITEFGKYGNFDSQYVNPNTESGKQKKPTVAASEIPMAWPTGAGFTPGHIYVNDTYMRRVVRADLVWKAEQSCAVK